MTNYASNESRPPQAARAIMHFDMYGAVHPAIFVQRDVRPGTAA